ncbi:MAG: bifunctional adenosylcobinamide kinase/adenosylcobinamide-phosphate guanylyltransferase [Actinomycetota bacterium]
MDDRLLLDCGPETPRAALRHQGSLQSLSHIAITRDSPDHSAPMALLSRSWAKNAEPFTVIGPPSVIASWSSWTSPTDQVRWQVAMPGDVIPVAHYELRVLAATQDDTEAVIYDVTCSDNTRLLYAPSIVPLPQGTVTATAGRDFDLVLLAVPFPDQDNAQGKSGENDAHSVFPQNVIRLGEVGAVTKRTKIIPVDLSHHSPPDLLKKIASWGGQVVDDGHAFSLARVFPSPAHTPAQPPQRVTTPPLPLRTLILGGARSGKSAFAERLLAGANVTYVATGPRSHDSDPDWQARVQSHQARRPAHWRTIETTDINAALYAADGPVLVDCLSLWLTDLMSRCGAWRDSPGWVDALDSHIDALVIAWQATTVPVVAVSSEVGSGVIPGTTSGRLFRDWLGVVNTRLSLASDRVLLVIAGRYLDLSAPPAINTDIASTLKGEL